MRIYILLFLLLVFGYRSQSQEVVRPAANRPIRVLIIDGFSNHDWKQTTLMVKNILEETGRFAVDVSTAPNTADEMSVTSWAPEFEKYSVVIQNTNNIQDTGLRALMEGRHISCRLQMHRLSNDPDPGDGMAGYRKSDVSCSA